MYNHSDVWKNITMIILFLIFILVLFLKFKFYINFEFNGIESCLEIKFLFWKIKKKWRLVAKSMPKNKSKKFSNDINISKNKSKKFSNKKDKNLKNNEKSKDHLKEIYKQILKNFKFEKLYIHEEVGLIYPDITAFAVPIALFITLFYLDSLNLKVQNFKYDVKPIYTSLKFDVLIKAEISFYLISIIFCIINQFLHKLFLRIRR